MPANASSASRFDNLRPWQGSQSRAFEELSYQLLKSDVPKGTQAVRTGNPDGGVEWYATRDDGSEEGWQAKHIHDFRNLLKAMSSTVSRVVRDRPQLVKLTFVISSNLTAATGSGRRRSQRQRYEEQIATWKRKIPGAAAIEFALVQESDLLDKLAEPKHRGRAWFWWGAPVLSEGWLEDRLAEQSEAAGERYRPDLQVDLPIEDDLKALGFAKSMVDKFETLRRRVISSSRDMRVTPSGPKKLVKLHEAIRTSGKSLLDVCVGTRLAACSAASNLEPVERALARFLDAVHEGELLERTLHGDWRELPENEPDREKKKPPQEALGYSVRELRNDADELASWLDSSEGRAFRKRSYFLIGPAGSGKTHLFLDAARRAIDEARPAVVLFGARFGKGNLWESVCDQAGLDPVGADVLLGAMDAAGEASGLEGRRFVILVDALNETVPPDFWLSHLPALRAAIARWPSVALAVSCRDTYLDLVDEGAERSKYVQRTHPGFVGREVEATQKYFAHYELEAPRIPLLIPEFTLPLFLRMYCESLRDAGETTAAVGHEGRVRIFERYLAMKMRRVARRLRPQAGSGYELERAQRQVAAVVDALLDQFASSGSEATSIATAEGLATIAIGSADDAAVVLGALQSEGVLTRERLYLGADGSSEGLRIVFQAFADFLVLRRRLASSSDPINDPDLRAWLSEQASWGIVEASAVVLPELYQIELTDFLGLRKESLREPKRDDIDGRRRYGRARNAYRSLVETLPHRDAAAISDRTIELLNEGMQLFSWSEIFRTMFQIAPQPANPLNANRLHRYLLQFKMPERDATFGFAMFHEIWDDSTPVTALARWASSGPYPDYDAEVIELASIPLVWLLSSSNRYMRDWVTKALVQLLRGHLDVAGRLLDRFWSIDDPYVVQRLVVIGYGALMRSDHSPNEAAKKKLTARVRKLVFSSPVRADELLLDAGRGIVEYGVHHGLLPKAALKDIRRPYGIAPPSNPPKEETLEKKYGYKKDQPIDQSYSTIFYSLMTMGDFGRYVVEAGMRHFSRYRLDQVFPDEEPWPEPRLVKTRWKKFERSLNTTQRQALEAIEAETNTGEGERLDVLLTDFRAALSARQRKLLSDSWQRPVRKFRNDDYPADRARRWVFRRTLSIGWTPQLFGHEDRLVGQGRSGREEHKAERWGKKYQWIAYHELLARVADNYQAARHYSTGPYEGLYQIIGDREIDPSLPPIPYRELAERSGEGTATWPPSAVSIPNWPPAMLNFARYGASIDKFLEDRASESTLDVLTLTDAQGVSWLLLEALIPQGDPDAHKSWLGLQQAFALDSWFVPQGQGRDLLPKLAALRKHDHWSLVDTHGHVDCCYVGELGWVPHECYHAHRDFDHVEFEGQTWTLAATVETYTWEGSLLDCSIGESVSTTAPSSFVQSRSDLLHEDDRGPSWVDETGAIAFTNIRDESGRQRAFIVRATWLRQFLEANKLELMVATWRERMYLDSDHRQHYPSEEVHEAGWVDAQLQVRVSDEIRERR